jgi:D-alanyl-D-alanine-carboxypeptidase/D-alanyl-D-alanine-endopeptidase
MGMGVSSDCELGLTLAHGGGYPGYGSYVLLLPHRGVGIFAFSNLTYASVWKGVWAAAAALEEDKQLGKKRPTELGPELTHAHGTATELYASGNVSDSVDMLAVNFLLDRGAELWDLELAEIKAEVGDCHADKDSLTATGRLSGTFTWRCEHGRVKGSLLLAPTRKARIQELELEVSRF